MPNDIPVPFSPLLTRQQTADFLQISLRKLDDLAARGVLPKVQMDGSVRYDRADIDAYIRACKQQATTRSKPG